MYETWRVRNVGWHCGWGGFATVTLLLLLLGGTSARAGEVFTLGSASPPPAARVLPAEFEPHDAVLLSWHAEDLGVQQSLAELIASGWRSTQFVMLVQDSACREQATEFLAEAGIPPGAVRYLRATCDTIWTRDFGPLLVRTGKNQVEMIDADYDRGERPNDDRVPLAIADQLFLPSVHLPLTVEGGNLLSNGRGVCLATSKLLHDNVDRGYAEEQVRDLMQIGFGADQTVFLEPLLGEPTGHVDMFAAFVSVDTVVVGDYAESDDPLNAAVLDRNAELLSQVTSARGPLQVVRLPMPARGDADHWRTYTNVLFANRQLLVPVYADADEHGRSEMLATYRRLMPGWRITPVDCTSLIELGGALHCVSMNLTRVNRLPRAFPPEIWPEADAPAPGFEFWNPRDIPGPLPEESAQERWARRFRVDPEEDIFGDSPSEMFGGNESDTWPTGPGYFDARPRVPGARSFPPASARQAPSFEQRRAREFGSFPGRPVEPPGPRE